MSSFFQFHYCSLCKINHKQKRKKHIYSKRHQEILKHVLKKLYTKIMEGKATLASPLVQERGWQAGAKFWCYFCQVDVEKHKAKDNCTLAYSSLIEHIGSNEHFKNMMAFFWENIVPQNQKADFIIGNEDYNRYILLSEKAVLEYQEKFNKKIQETAAKIAEASRRNQYVMWVGSREQLLKQTFASVAKNEKKEVGIRKIHTGEHRGDLGGARKTIAAYGEGLTCIIHPEEEDTKKFTGNVYTDATPPWLLEDNERSGSKEIGPTMKDLEKHLEQERKSKMPACRVGAGFNHKVDTSAEWLPIFGRVWNNGRRLTSHHQFLKERKSGVAATVTSSKDKSTFLKLASKCMPYKRRKNVLKDHISLDQAGTLDMGASHGLLSVSSERGSDKSQFSPYNGGYHLGNSWLCAQTARNAAKGLNETALGEYSDMQANKERCQSFDINHMSMGSCKFSSSLNLHDHRSQNFRTVLAVNDFSAPTVQTCDIFPCREQSSSFVQTQPRQVESSTDSCSGTAIHAELSWPNYVMPYHSREKSNRTMSYPVTEVIPISEQLLSAPLLTEKPRLSS